MRALVQLVLLWPLTLFLCVAPGDVSAQWLSPGPLAEDHRDLDDENSCAKCHSPGESVEASRCLDCHDVIDDALRKGRGFHTALVRDANNRCETCHSDHKGRGYPLIRWSPPASFDHEADTGFALDGAHATASCASCHTERPKYMGVKVICFGCHEKQDPHQGKLGKRCDDCHSTRAFRPASGFDHAKTDFPLTDKHAAVSCAGCHKGGVLAGGSFEVPKHQRCTTCHTDPHRGRTSLSSCTDCHSTKGWDQVDAVPPAHSPAGWPLVGEHAGVGCVDCHGESVNIQVKKDCISCHNDPHAGRLGRNCAECHNEGGWAKMNAPGFDHGRTRYPLKAAHRKVRCNSCHKRGGKSVYRGLKFDRCDRCHSDHHDQKGEQQGATFITPPRPTACDACHDLKGFEVSTFTAVDHQAARFELKGSHLAVACAKCHAPPATGGVGATELVIGLSRCDDCHKDYHEGSFEDEMAGAQSCDACHSVEGWKRGNFDHSETGFALSGIHADASCKSCHLEAPNRYDGLEARCESCHVDVHAGQFQANTGRAAEAAVKTAAAAAAAAEVTAEAEAEGDAASGTRPDVTSASRPGAQPTSGAGAEAESKSGSKARSCESCHGDESATWELMPFDHTVQALWPLDGKHAPLECASCHQPKSADGLDAAAKQGLDSLHKDVIAYRLGYRDCGDCHDNPHRSHKPSLANRAPRESAPTISSACATCHDVSGWELVPDDIPFDHAATGFALRGRHAKQKCTTCHGPQLQSGRAQPECASCHGDDSPHRGELGPRCESCHDDSARDWQPSRPHLLHRETRFPLAGAHAAADCQACHVQWREDGYRGVPLDCFGCHFEDYGRDDVHPNHITAQFDTACDKCHSQASFFPARFDHDIFFPLRGGHALVSECTDCHQGGQFGGTPQDCYSCHANDPAYPPSHTTYSRQCQDCHTDTDWTTMRGRWHEPLFPLASGDHAFLARDCLACHFDSVSKSSFACTGCHEHNEGAMRARHGGVGAFVYESFGCYSCHPMGNE